MKNKDITHSLYPPQNNKKHSSSQEKLTINDTEILQQKSKQNQYDIQMIINHRKQLKYNEQFQSKLNNNNKSKKINIKNNNSSQSSSKFLSPFKSPLSTNNTTNINNNQNQNQYFFDKQLPKNKTQPNFKNKSHHINTSQSQRSLLSNQQNQLPQQQQPYTTSSQVTSPRSQLKQIQSQTSHSFYSKKPHLLNQQQQKQQNHKPKMSLYDNNQKNILSLNNTNNSKQITDNENYQKLENTLKNLIQYQQESCQILNTRTQQLEDLIINVLQPDNFNLKLPQDYDRLCTSILELCQTLRKTSKNEIDTGQILRENERIKLILANNDQTIKKLKRKIEDQQKHIQIQSQTHKLLEEEYLQQKIQLNTEKQSSIASKTQQEHLEKRVQVILDNELSENLNPNDRVRACLNELLKENESLKRDLEYKNKELQRERGKCIQEKVTNQRLNSMIDKKKKIVSSSTSATPHQEQIRNYNYHHFQPTINTKEDIDLLGNFKIPHSIDFRIQSLRQDKQVVIKDLLENGEIVFANSLIEKLSKKQDQVEMTELIAKQFISFRNFAQRQNQLQYLFLEVISKYDSLPTQIAYLNYNLPSIFQSKQVNIWLVDSLSGCLITYDQEGKIKDRILMNKGIVGELFQQQCAVSLTNCQKKLVHYSVQTHQQTHADSLLMAPLISKKLLQNEESQFQGVLQILDSDTQIFGFDEQYLLIVLTEMLENHVQKMNQLSQSLSQTNFLDNFIQAFQSLVSSASEIEFQTNVNLQVENVTGIRQSQFYFIKIDQETKKPQQLYKYDQKHQKQTFSCDHGLIGLTTKSYCGNIITNAKMNSNFSPLVDLSTLLPIFTMPVVRKNNDAFQEDYVIGVIQVVLKSKLKNASENQTIDPSKDLRGISQESYNILKKLGDIISLAHNYLVTTAQFKL